MKTEKPIYQPTLGEEVANTISHGIMALFMLLTLPFSAVWVYLHNTENILASVCVSVFMISLFLMFLGSTLYHSMSPLSRHKKVFHLLDHILIYVAIAGTYTPVALMVIGGWQGVLIVALQWVMVLFGIFYKTLSRGSIPAISLTIYLVMGWTIVLFLPALISNGSREFLFCIALGGLLYTLGAWVYARKGFVHHHLVWHLLINLAVVAHMVGIVFWI